MRNVLLAGFAVFAVAAMLGCGGSGSDSYGTGPAGPGPSGPGDDPYGDPGNGTGNGAGGGAIVMGDTFFDPQVDTVTVGTTVVWENQGGLVHTSTSDDDLWDSGDVSPGQDASHTFSAQGEFAYHCEIHVDEGMVGTVVVVE